MLSRLLSIYFYPSIPPSPFLSLSLTPSLCPSLLPSLNLSHSLSLSLSPLSHAFSLSSLYYLYYSLSISIPPFLPSSFSLSHSLSFFPPCSLIKNKPNIWEYQSKSIFSLTWYIFLSIFHIIKMWGGGVFCGGGGVFLLFFLLAFTS